MIERRLAQLRRAQGIPDGDDGDHDIFDADADADADAAPRPSVCPPDCVSTIGSG
jgi:hypothetical protein